MQLPWGDPFGVQLEDWFSKEGDAAGRGSQSLAALFPGFHRVRVGTSFVKQGNSGVFWGKRLQGADPGNTRADVTSSE